MQKIFISSTFSDMQDERDLIQKYVVPELRKFAQEAYDDLQMIDLRWGVKTEDLDEEMMNAKIFNTCLNEVEKCKPHMLVFLGERYGTIMNREVLERECLKRNFAIDNAYEYSFTALEIEYGLLRKHYGDIEQCIICFREPIEISEADSEMNLLYKEYEEQKIQELEKLKKRLEELNGYAKTTHIVKYTAKLAEDKRSLCDFITVDEQMELRDKLVLEFKNIFSVAWEKNKKMNVYERELENAKSISNQYAYRFFGRETFIEECLRKLTTCDLLVLEGKEGIGKTAIAAKISLEMQAAGYQVFHFYGGMGSYSTSGELLNEQVKYFFGNTKSEKVFLCIDGVDNVKRDDCIFYLQFLPKLCKNVKALITYRSNRGDNMLGGELMIRPAAFLYRNYEIIQVPQLDESSKRKIIQGVSEQSGRDFSKQLVEIIIGKECSGNILYLSMILDMLNLTDGNDLRNLRTGEEISMLMERKVLEFPDSIEEAVIYLLEKIIQQMQVKGYIKEALSLIASSRNGLRLSDIFEILNDEMETEKAFLPREFVALTNYFTVLLYEDNYGVLRFKHASFKEGFKIHVADRIWHTNEDLILYHIRNRLSENDLLRKNEEFFYTFNTIGIRYYKHRMNMLKDIPQRFIDNKGVLADVKYFGWYGHGKKYYQAMDKYFKSVHKRKRVELLLFFVDDYWELYDKSHNELGQIQLLYDNILKKYIYQIQNYDEQIWGYIQMKCYLIIAYIFLQRGWKERAKECLRTEKQNRRIRLYRGEKYKKNEQLLYELEIFSALTNGDDEILKFEELSQKKYEDYSSFIKEAFIKYHVCINLRLRETVKQVEGMKIILEQIRECFEKHHHLVDLKNYAIVYMHLFNLTKEGDEKQKMAKELKEVLDILTDGYEKFNNPLNREKGKIEEYLNSL